MTDSSNNTQSLSSSTLKSAAARSDTSDRPQPVATATKATTLNSSHRRKIVRTTAKRHLPRFSLGSSTHVNVVVLANKKKKKTKHNSSTASAFTMNDSAVQEKPSSVVASNTTSSREQQQQQSSKNGTTTPPLILASSSSSQSSSSTLTPQHDLMNPTTARETNQNNQTSSKATTPIVTPPPLPSEIQKQGLETKESSKTIPAGVHPKPVSTAASKTPPPKRKRKLPAKFRDNEDGEDDKKKKKSSSAAGTKPARALPLTKVQRRLPTSSAAGSPATAESLKTEHPNSFNVDESKSSKDTSANAAASSFSFALTSAGGAAAGGHKLLPSTPSFHRQPGNNFIIKKPKLHSALQKKTPPQIKNNANSSSSSKKKKKNSIPTGAEAAEAQAADAAKRAEDDRKGIIIPRRHDVILGRGNGVAQHDGNVQFRQFCWSVRKAYMQAYRYVYIHVLREFPCDLWFTGWVLCFTMVCVLTFEYDWIILNVYPPWETVWLTKFDFFVFFFVNHQNGEARSCRGRLRHGSESGATGPILAVCPKRVQGASVDTGAGQQNLGESMPSVAREKMVPTRTPAASDLYHSSSTHELQGSHGVCQKRRRVKSESNKVMDPDTATATTAAQETTARGASQVPERTA